MAVEHIHSTGRCMNQSTNAGAGSHQHHISSLNQSPQTKHIITKFAMPSQYRFVFHRRLNPRNVRVPSTNTIGNEYKPRRIGISPGKIIKSSNVDGAV